MSDKKQGEWGSNGFQFKKIETGAGLLFVLKYGGKAVRAVPDGLPSLHFQNPAGKYPDEFSCAYLGGAACSFQTIFIAGRMPEGISDEDSFLWLCEVWDKLFS